MSNYSSYTASKPTSIGLRGLCLYCTIGLCSLLSGQSEVPPFNPYAFSGEVPRALKSLKMELDQRLSSNETATLSLTKRSGGSFNLKRLRAEQAFFVIDTSGSMRSYEDNQLRPEVVERVMAIVSHMPELHSVSFIDGSGHIIFDWRRDGGLYAVPQGLGIPFSEIRNSIRRYPYESMSSFDSGLNRVGKLVRPSDNREKIEVFVVGDEYTGSFWQDWSNLKDSLHGLRINVLKGYDYDFRALSHYSSINSFKKFEYVQLVLPALTGGMICELHTQPRAGILEATLLSRLAREHVGWRWAVSESVEKVDTWNEILKSDQFIDGQILVSEFSEGAGESVDCKLSIEVKNKRSGKQRAYLALETLNGGWGCEYMATVSKVGGRWVIDEWKLLWKDGQL